MTAVVFFVVVVVLLPGDFSSLLAGSHRRNAERRLRGARGQPACRLHLEFLLLHLSVPPFPLPVCTTCSAQDHLWRATHLLSLCDLWPALHLTSVDHRAERKFQAQDVFLLSEGTGESGWNLSFLPDLQLSQGGFKPRSRPLWLQVVLLWHLCKCICAHEQAALWFKTSQKMIVTLFTC